MISETSFVVIDRQESSTLLAHAQLGFGVCGALFLLDSLGFCLRRCALRSQHFDLAHSLHRGVEVASFCKLFCFLHQVAHQVGVAHDDGCQLSLLRKLCRVLAVESIGDATPFASFVGALALCYEIPKVMLEIFFVAEILSVLDLVVAEVELLVVNLGASADILTRVGKKSVWAEADKTHFANIVVPEVFQGHVNAVAIAVAAEKLVQSFDKTLIIAISRHGLLGDGLARQANDEIAAES